MRSSIIRPCAKRGARAVNHRTTRTNQGYDSRRSAVCVILTTFRGKADERPADARPNTAAADEFDAVEN